LNLKLFTLILILYLGIALCGYIELKYMFIDDISEISIPWYYWAMKSIPIMFPIIYGVLILPISLIFIVFPLNISILLVPSILYLILFAYATTLWIEKLRAKYSISKICMYIILAFIVILSILIFFSIINSGIYSLINMNFLLLNIDMALMLITFTPHILGLYVLIKRL